MTLLVHSKMAINSLRGNKIRTFLTLLGIIIGVTSVTTIIGLGEGVKKQVNEQIRYLGSDIVTVVPGRVTSSQFSPLTNSALPTNTSARLTEKDLGALSNLADVDKIAATMQLSASIVRNSTKLTANILAVDEHYLDLSGHKLASGQFFGGDLVNNYTILISEDLASKLFGPNDPIGSTLSVKGTNFTIVGVLERKPDVLFSTEADELALITLPAGREINNNRRDYQQIQLRALKNVGADTLAKEVQNALLKTHEGEEDFTVITQEQLLNTTDSMFKTLTNFIAAVASISLLVGGIGVMNIMLVTVTERTREIGIRKAIGATRTQILMQFLVEALMITMIGGLIGIGLSALLGYIIRSQTAIESVFNFWILLLALLVSLGVGVIFGTWPALRAARKDAIEALRHE